MRVVHKRAGEAAQNPVAGSIAVKFEDGALTIGPPAERRAIEGAVSALDERGSRCLSVWPPRAEIVQHGVAPPVRSHFEDSPDIVPAAVVGRAVKGAVGSLEWNPNWPTPIIP